MRQENVESQLLENPDYPQRSATQLFEPKVQKIVSFLPQLTNIKKGHVKLPKEQRKPLPVREIQLSQKINVMDNS